MSDNLHQILSGAILVHSEGQPCVQRYCPFLLKHRHSSQKSHTVSFYLIFCYTKVFICFIVFYIEGFLVLNNYIRLSFIASKSRNWKHENRTCDVCCICISAISNRELIVHFMTTIDTIRSQAFNRVVQEFQSICDTLCDVKHIFSSVINRISNVNCIISNKMYSLLVISIAIDAGQMIWVVWRSMCVLLSKSIIVSIWKSTSGITSGVMKLFAKDCRCLQNGDLCTKTIH